jgi:hypothetical protein
MAAMTKVTPLFALWLGATLSGCVPNGYEASTVVLLVTPLAVAVGYALVAGLVRLAKREVPITLAAPAALAGTSLVLGLASLYFASGEVDVGEWFLPGVAFFGASFLTVFLVAFRVGQRVAPLRSTDFALGVTTLALLSPLPLGYSGDDALFTWVLVLWIVPGIYGIPPLVVLLALVIEALRERRRAVAPAPG